MDSILSEDESKKATWFDRLCFFIPQRYILAFFGFFALVNAFTMRICLSVAIVRMVKPIQKNYNTSARSCSGLTIDEERIMFRLTGEEQLYEWSEALQGVIMSSFYYGYVITHIPGGLLAEKFGGKYVLSLGILISAVLSLVTPVVIEWGGPAALIFVRILEGLGQGTMFPAMSVMLASWIPSHERGLIGSIVFGGAQIGTILGNSISGLMLQYFKGYSSVFYLFGASGVIWFILFTILCYDSPDIHPFVSEEEQMLLLFDLGQLKRDDSLPQTPWKSLFKSLPVWAIICAQIGQDWGLYTIITDLPKYMNDVLLFSISTNGLLSSLPHLVMLIVSILAGFLADWLTSRDILSATNTRKIFGVISSVFAGVFVVFASYSGCNKVATVVNFTISMGFVGVFYSGLKVNLMELSPNYSGSLMALSNGIGALTGILALSFVGLLTPNASLNEWRIVFWITCVMFILTIIVYAIWGSAEVQTWNEPPRDEQVRGRGETKSMAAISQIIHKSRILYY